MFFFMNVILKDSTIQFHQFHLSKMLHVFMILLMIVSHLDRQNLTRNLNFRVWLSRDFQLRGKIPQVQMIFSDVPTKKPSKSTSISPGISFGDFSISHVSVGILHEIRATKRVAQRSTGGTKVLSKPTTRPNLQHRENPCSQLEMWTSDVCQFDVP